MSEDYRGLLGAFPYAFRRSASWLFRSYVILGGLLAVVLTLLFVSAVITIVAATVDHPGGTLTFVRSLYVILGFLVLAPVLAPVLLVARRHRRTGSDARYDAAVAAAGYLFVVTLYLGIVASMPPEFQLDGEPTTRPAPSGITAPLIAALYWLPALASPLLPLAGALAIYAVHRRFR